MYANLSVITITRNNYHELLETIDSLHLLTECHLIVINGGECEQTREFLLKQKIEHISEPDDGISDAFNKGIRLALKNATNHIVFINSGDSVINASYAAKAVNFLEKNKDIAFTHGDIIFRDRLAGDIYMPYRQLRPGRAMPFNHPSMIYRKSVFEKVGFFDNSYKIAMDYEHLCRMIKFGSKGVHIMAPPFISMDGSGVSATSEETAIKECYTALLENGLLPGNRKDFIIRLLLFVAKKTLTSLRLNGFLTKYRRNKYSRPIPVSIKPGKFIIVTNSYKRDITLVERSLRHSLSQVPAPQRIVFIDQNENKLQLSLEISQNPLLQHLHIHKKSVSVARNYLKISPDIEWIIFCDDDGYLMEGYTRKLFEIVEYYPNLEIIAGSIIRDDNGEFYTPRHKMGGNLNKFRHAKLLMGSNFVCKSETFKRLGGFDERFGVGTLWGSGEETDFVWKAHFARVPMLYRSDLKVFHVKPYASTFFNNLKKAFNYSKGKGALVAKWIFEKKKLKPFWEMGEMILVPLGQTLKATFTLSFEMIAIYLITLLARCWGFFLFSGNFLFFRGKKSTPKVFFITVRSDVGGSSQHLLTLVDEIKKRGFIPYMAFPDGFPTSENLRRNAFFYMDIPHRKFSLVAFLRILVKLKLDKVRIVHSHGRGAGLYSRFLFFFGFKVVHTFHGIHVGNSKYDKFKTLADRILRLFAHTYICVSSDEKSKAVRYSFARNKQIQIVNNGVSVDYICKNLQKIDISEAKKVLDIDGGNKLLVGTLSRLDPVKNLDGLIRFIFQWKKVKRHLPCQFLIAGNGTERNPLLKLIKDYQLEEDVCLIGEVQKPLSFLACLDAYVSCSRSEGLPLSVLEAMSVPLPCLLSDIEGHRCLAIDGGVSLFSPKVYNDFATKLERIIDDSAYKERLCKRALETVRMHYNVDNMVNKTLDIYNHHICLTGTV